MDHWIIVNFFDRGSDGSLDHSLILGTDIGLGAMERWIIGSLLIFLGQTEQRIDGSLDHSLILGIDIGVGAMDQWIIVNSFGSEGSMDQWIIGSLLFFLTEGAMDHWIFGS